MKDNGAVLYKEKSKRNVLSYWLTAEKSEEFLKYVKDKAWEISFWKKMSFEDWLWLKKHNDWKALINEIMKDFNWESIQSKWEKWENIFEEEIKWIKNVINSIAKKNFRKEELWKKIKELKLEYEDIPYWNIAKKSMTWLIIAWLEMKKERVIKDEEWEKWKNRKAIEQLINEIWNVTDFIDFKNKMHDVIEQVNNLNISFWNEILMSWYDIWDIFVITASKIILDIDLDLEKYDFLKNKEFTLWESLVERFIDKWEEDWHYRQNKYHLKLNGNFRVLKETDIKDLNTILQDVLNGNDKAFNVLKEKEKKLNSILAKFNS
jgi:hypothetical protein